MSLKSGWLLKQGLSMKGWQRRWFILDNTSLSCYLEPGGERRTFLSVSDIAEISLAPELERPNTFRIVIPFVRVLFVCAESESECSAWINALTRASSHRKISVDSFEIIRLIGSGKYGKVHLVRQKENGECFALKSMNKRFLEKNDRVCHVFAERDVVLDFRHPFVVAGHCSFQSVHHVFLVLDYVPGGELLERLEEEGQLSGSRAQLYAAELTLAIGFLHSKNCVYRDVKAENVLIDEDGHVKLTDFGVAKLGMAANSTTGTFCGTPEYMAPEMVKGVPHTRAVDWWGLGVLVFEMLTGFPPFSSENVLTVYEMILNSKVPFPEEMDPVAVDFIGRLLDKNPETRLGSGVDDVEELKKHPYFTNIDWDRVYKKEYRPQWIPKFFGELEDQELTKQEQIVSDEEEPLDPETQGPFEDFSSSEEM
jgi:serine/threonine protein kinase